MERISKTDVGAAIERWCEANGRKVDRLSQGRMLVEADGKHSVVEVTGMNTHGGERTREFRSALLRLMSLADKYADSELVLAVPKETAVGVADRRSLIPTAWARIAQAFPELNVWYVDAEKAEVVQVDWKTAGGEGDPTLESKPR